MARDGVGGWHSQWTCQPGLRGLQAAAGTGGGTSRPGGEVGREKVAPREGWREGGEQTELYLALGGVRAGSGAASLLQLACCLPRVPGEALGWQGPASGLQPSHVRRPPACQAGCLQGGTLAEQVEGSLHFSRHSVGISSWLMPSVFVTQPWMLSTSGQGLPELACPASRLPGLSVGQVFAVESVLHLCAAVITDVRTTSSCLLQMFCPVAHLSFDFIGFVLFSQCGH